MPLLHQHCLFFIRLLLCVIFAISYTSFAYPSESEDSLLYITGYDAFLKKDYLTASERMSLILQKYPDTPLRDVVMFLRARADYNAGKRKEAAKEMARFCREYPDSALKETAESELLQMATEYQIDAGQTQPYLLVKEEKAIKGQEGATEAPEMNEAYKLDLPSAKGESVVENRGSRPNFTPSSNDLNFFRTNKTPAERMSKIREILKKRSM